MMRMILRETRKLGSTPLALLTATVLSWHANAGTPPALATNQTLCVMTYNLKYASETQPNAWSQRRPLVAECIRQADPDLLGTQEGLHAQLKDIAADLPAYAWVGQGREGGNKSEFMAIFYRKSRLEPLADDHFWLSDTPEIAGSSTWGNSNRRMVTWVKFRDRATAKEFYHFNTHLDHEVQIARERGAALIRRRVERLNTSLPVILTGDFNCTVSNKAHQILVDSDFFKDTWLTARERRGEGLGTFNGFKAIPKNNTRIDWILARGSVEVSITEIITFSRDNQFPSDHFPLVARMQFGKEE